MRVKTTIQQASIIAIAIVAEPSAAANLLANPGFEESSNDGYYSFTGTGGDGSSAVDWFVDNFNYGTTSTTAVTPPPGLANSGNYSMFLSSNAIDNGVIQGISGNQFGSTVYSVSGWVYLVSGSVGLQLAGENETNITTYASTSQTGQWISLAANTGGVSGIFDFNIVALSANAEFYADNMDADTLPLPEPASFALLGVGAAGLLVRRCRIVR